MYSAVKAVIPDSPAAKTIIVPGDVLWRVNGSKIADVLDYMYFSYDSELLLEMRSAEGKVKLVKLSKPEGADIGLVFESFLMDRERSCVNKCIFCFIDQLPKGMRETLYYKDDDLRLSFFQGNYITLSNLSESDIQRIVDLRISPINVSVHTMDRELRAHMLGSKRGAQGVDLLETLLRAGIVVNCQIVCCPGVNDGDELSRTIEALIALGQGINSVSVVPVGLTRHREGLAELRPFDSRLALETVSQVERYGEKCFEKYGKRVFYPADELYVLAGLEFPPDGFYDDYPQLENGVGMMRLLLTQFEAAVAEYEASLTVGAEPEKEKAEFTGESSEGFSVVTGLAVKEYFTNLLMTADDLRGRMLGGKVYAIRNDFFGEGITVSGLVTGGDIIAQLKGKNLGARLLLPRNMLRSGEDVFLDDVTVSQVSEALGVPVRIVEPDGADLLRAFLGD